MSDLPPGFVLDDPPQAPAAPSAALPSGYSLDGAPAPDPSTVPVYSGSVLPMTRYADGHVGFDSNAGILGMAKNAAQGIWGAATLPGDVATGKVDPNSQEAVNRSFDMAALGAGDIAAPGMAAGMTRAATVIPPTADALKAAGSAGFDAARNMGVEYSSPSVAALAKGVQDQLNADGILSENAPNTHGLLNRLQAVPSLSPGDTSSVPFGNLDAARKSFGNFTQNFNNPTDAGAAARAKAAVNDFIGSGDPGNIVSGAVDAPTAAKTLADAIANYGAGMRSDRLNGIEDAAELRANAANSGANIGNATRSRVASLLLSPKASSGYSPDELAALGAVTNGTTFSNTARTIGNLLGGGGGMHGAMTGVSGAIMGHEAGGVPGAIVGATAPLVGWGAKSLDNSLTQGRLTAADELVRQRSPLYRALTAQAPQEIDPAAKRAALTRALMLSPQPAGPQSSTGQ